MYVYIHPWAIYVLMCNSFLYLHYSVFNNGEHEKVFIWPPSCGAPVGAIRGRPAVVAANHTFKFHLRDAKVMVV